MTFNDQRSFEGLAYGVIGSGPPVIALHGLGETHFTWRHIVQLRSDRYTFYLFDLKGHGQSEAPRDGRYSLEDQASTLCRFIEFKNLDKVSILGHSFGGGIGLFIALKLARTKSQRLKFLILIDSIGAPQRIPFFIRLIRFQYLLSMAVKLLSPNFLVRQFLLRKAYTDTSRLSEELVSAYARNLLRTNGVYALSTTAKQLLAVNPLHWLGEFGEINAPTLILFGKGDRIVRPYVGIQLNVAIPNSELDWLPCGHMPQEEVPELVAEKIDHFFQKHSLTAAADD